MIEHRDPDLFIQLLSKGRIYKGPQQPVTCDRCHRHKDNRFFHYKDDDLCVDCVGELQRMFTEGEQIERGPTTKRKGMSSAELMSYAASSSAVNSIVTRGKQVTSEEWLAKAETADGSNWRKR